MRNTPVDEDAGEAQLPCVLLEHDVRLFFPVALLRHL